MSLRFALARARLRRNVIGVLAVPGQSNQKGSNDGSTLVDPSAIAPQSTVHEWPSASHKATGALIQASEPLGYPGEISTNVSIGGAMRIAKQMVARGEATRVIILPVAKGGTGFIQDGDWAVGGVLHEGMVSSALALKAQIASTYPGATSTWYSLGKAGEDDSGATATALLDKYIEAHADFETRVGVPLHVLAHRISAAWRGTTFAGNAIDAAQMMLRERIPRYTIVEGATTYYSIPTGNIHFDAPGQIVMADRKLQQLARVKARTAPFAPGIDLFGGVTQASRALYSLWRRLLAGYSGFALRILRTSDNTTLDVGFDAGGRVNFAAISAFCAGTDGQVVIWYDQSGNGLDYVRTTVAGATQAGPLLLSAGLIRWRNGRPAMGGGNTILVNAGGEPSSAGALVVAGDLTNSGTRVLFSSRGMQLRVAGGQLISDIHSAGTTTSGFDLTAGVHVVMARSTAYQQFVDGVEDTTLTASATSTATFVGGSTILGRQIVADGALSALYDGFISELFVTNTAWSSTDRAAIHAGTVASYFADPAT